MRPLVFGFVVVPHFSLIALSACVDPLRLANQVLGRAAYQSVLLSVEGGLVHSSDGIAVMSQHSLAQAPVLDVVFVIGLADGMFPGRRSIEDNDVEEERRLFYVAVTRAKNELYLCYPKIASRAGPGGMMLNPSRFLTELPSHLYDTLRIKRQFGW